MKCFGAFAKDEEIRKLGSSGAMFPILAIACIRKGGIVYASIYDEQLNVKFSRIEDEAHLQASFTSKYAQSIVGATFRNVATDLKAGRSVLFCGTPCQAAGLRLYLNKRRLNCERLLLAEIICHGVPSQDIYQMAMERCHPGCVSLNMRNKELGWDWGGFAWKMRFADGSEQVIPQADIPYMKGFLGNIFLRPSCYRCAVKPSKLVDITLGDFWGICFVNKDIPARYGVSSVILHTKAGEDAFSSIEQDIEFFEVTYGDILPYNPRLETSVPKSVYRNRFYKKLLSDPNTDIEALINDLCSPSIFDKLLNRVYQKLPQGNTPVRDLTEKKERLLYSSKEQCCGCGACHNICPNDAILMKKDKEGFLYAVIDQTKCIDCGACTSVCPFNSINNLS